ncbi:MAG: hypothetical protein RPS47_09295 [Colwellia sp.]|jgi:hypothetical protein
MHIVVSKAFQEFVAGIFSEKEYALDFIQRIPESDSGDIKHFEVDCCYPFYISEDHEGFSYLTENEVASLVSGFIVDMNNRDEDWCYTNLYKITKNFQPKFAGKDYMGSLPHYHIDNFSLIKIKESGVEALWRN